MSEKPPRPHKSHQGVLVIATACGAGLLLLSLLFGVGMGRILADIWVSVMAVIVDLAGGMFGAG